MGVRGGNQELNGDIWNLKNQEFDPNLEILFIRTAYTHIMSHNVEYSVPVQHALLMYIYRRCMICMIGLGLDWVELTRPI